MVRFGHERRHSVSRRSAAPTATAVMTDLAPPRSDQASLTAQAAPSVNTKTASNGRTEIEHRPEGELGAPRSQPYTVWYQGKTVYFCTTKEEAVNVLSWELRQPKFGAVLDGEGDTPEAPGIG